MAGSKVTITSVRPRVIGLYSVIPPAYNFAVDMTVVHPDGKQQEGTVRVSFDPRTSGGGAIVIFSNIIWR